MTGKTLVVNWLLQRNGSKIDYSTLETELKEYALKQGKHYRIDSLERYWRWTIEENLLERYGFKIVEVDGKYKTWQVQKIKQFELSL